VPPSSEALVQLPPDVALHARPAGALVRAAMRFAARVTITLESSGRSADARSVLNVMALGATAGATVRLRADGDDAAAAIAALTACIGSLQK